MTIGLSCMCIGVCMCKLRLRHFSAYVQQFCVRQDHYGRSSLSIRDVVEAHWYIRYKLVN